MADEETRNILALLGRPIAFHPLFAELCGGIASGILLSQALYWAKRTKDPDGWFYKTRIEWQEETGLNRGEQEQARTKLRATGFWFEARKGNPAKLFYRIDAEKFAAFMQGKRPSLTVGIVLKECKAALTGLSKTGMMRAQRLGCPKVEYVDYSKVLQEKGLICGICSEPINRPAGQKQGFLCFDHIVPLSKGGSHVFNNLQPAHSECNHAKGGGDPSRPSVDQLEGLGETNKSALTKPTPRVRPISDTETTSQTTSGRPQEKPRSPNQAIAKKEPKIPCPKDILVRFPEIREMFPDHQNSIDQIAVTWSEFRLGQTRDTLRTDEQWYHDFLSWISREKPDSQNGNGVNGKQQSNFESSSQRDLRLIRESNAARAVSRQAALDSIAVAPRAIAARTGTGNADGNDRGVG